MALRTSEEQYRGLMESLDSVVATVAARQLGGTPGDFIGKTLHELLPEPVAARQLESICAALRDDRGITRETQSPIQGRLRWYRTTIQPIHDAAGRPIYALVNSNDIHDLKTAQRELLALNQTLEERVAQRAAEVQDLYEHAPTGYHSLDPDGTIIRVNQTELGCLGYTCAELIGRPFTDLLTPPGQAAFPRDFVRPKEEGRVRDIDRELLRKDGSAFPVLIHATAVYDATGAFVMSRSTLTDLTERKATETALRQANADLARAARAKDEFLANMSHELRTPLSAILGYSEILLEGIHGSLTPDQQSILQRIVTSGQHLLALITDVLDLAKMEAGRLDLQPEKVSIVEVCQTSVLFVHEQAVKQGLQLDVDVNDHRATIEADPRRLKQMLVNLLANVVKFTPSPGRVQLAVVVDAAAGEVRFAVQDTGIGIAPAELARLFQPFVQLDSSLSRHYEGSGLGLALVRRLAELHGGCRLTPSSAAFWPTCCPRAL